MSKSWEPLKNRAKSLIEFLPAGRDIYLALAKNRLGISYRGVFDTPQAARAAVPASKPNFYDVINAKKAKDETKEKQSLESWFHVEDYALLFWLGRILGEDSALLELGGSVGHFFYTIQRYGICGPNVRWTIAELPEAAKLGGAIALERGERRLVFCDSSQLSAIEPVSVFMTAGTLQYMEAPLWAILPTLAKLPDHVLIHNLPVHKSQSYWTLQRLSLCEVPYRIYSHTELVDQMKGLGYQLVDTWNAPRGIEIPFHREIEVEGYLGFYFRLQR